LTSQGEMAARVPTKGSGDDLDRLSEDINDALSQLETTVDGIRQVTNDIAHDLRAPINRLGILLEQARSNSHNNKKYKDFLDDAAGEIQGVKSIFDALLRIAQIEAGARKSRFSPVSPHEIASAVYEAYSPVAEEHGQSLVIDSGPDSDVLIHGDKDLLTQLLANLIENAIGHCGSSALIRLEINRDLQGVRLSVRDNGPGIEADQRDRVLTRFFRLDKARNMPGSGLGLALVKAIAELHGAILTLKDNHPGLAVHVVFPVIDEAITRDDDE
jgi:signal transduction histidine kinase